MAKSLRWRLQIWHAMILFLVIVGFGNLLYIQMRRATLSDIDEELLGSARVIEASMRPSGGPPNFRPPRFRGDRPFSQPPARGPHRFDGPLLSISLSGLGVLNAGLVGGWWLSGRAIEPLESISSTASLITANNLTQRIDVSKMDSELEQLGEILNSMLQRLESSFEQQARFFAHASHELRTPIAVLLMHCELAMSRERSPADYQQTLKICSRAFERMRSLTEALLILARADAGQWVIRKCPVDLEEVVDECVRLLGSIAANHEIKIEVPASSSPCEGDSNHLVRVVSNLLNHAIVYNRPDGSVTLKTALISGLATLEIQDMGRGISREEQSHLFERFYRPEEARSRDTGGSGLGLAICKSIADSQGGKLTITSEEDVGTLVRFTIPTSSQVVANESTDPQAEFSSQ